MLLPNGQKTFRDWAKKNAGIQNWYVDHTPLFYGLVEAYGHCQYQKKPADQAI